MTDQIAGAQTPTDAPVQDGQSGAAPAPVAGASLLTGGDAAPAGDAAKAATTEGAETGQAGEGEGKPEAKAEGAPEKYEFTMPDGVELDTKAVEQFEPALRELNLSNEQASKLVAKFAEWRAAEVKAADEAFVQQVEGWAKQVKEDPDIGGAAFDTNVKAAQSAIAAFASPELRTLLDSTGLGNHPEVVRFCMRIGKSLAEDKTARPAGAGGGTRSLEERLYGNGQ